MKKRLLLVIALAVAATAAWQPVAARADQRTVSFAEGQWDAEQWTPLRLPSYDTTPAFVQQPDCLRAGPFTREQVKAHLDNVLLMTDTGTDEGQFEVEFRIGPEHGTAPGVFLSPTLDGDALTGGIAVFVADYTMAVWRVGTDPDTLETGYEHLVRMNRYQDPAVRHVLRCRYSKARRSIALQIDDSDVIMLRLPEFEINPRIGIWGCHGTCDYYRVTMTTEGTLPWAAEPPDEK